MPACMELLSVTLPDWLCKYLLTEISGVSGTKVLVCGTAARASPPNQLGQKCPAGTFSKRTTGFNIALDGVQKTCTLDSTGNPYQNCLNSLTDLCEPGYLGTNNARLTNCKKSIDSAFSKVIWKNYVGACAIWKGGNPDSQNCGTSTNQLLAGAVYVADGVSIKLTKETTDNVHAKLWKNGNLTSTSKQWNLINQDKVWF